MLYQLLVKHFFASIFFLTEEPLLFVQQFVCSSLSSLDLSRPPFFLWIEAWEKVKDYMLHTPLFGILCSLIAFELGHLLRKKTKSDLFNPLLLAMVFTSSFLLLFHIPLEAYQLGGSFIQMFLGPATTALGLIIYQHRSKLKAAFWPVVLASSVGALSSIVSVYFLGKFFQLDQIYLNSLYAKSSTTPFALSLTETVHGIPSLAVVAVTVTGVMGAVLAPFLVRLFHMRDKIGIGVSIGTCSHALGTSRAIEMGEVQGAMSSVAICTTGLWTVLFILLFFH